MFKISLFSTSEPNSYKIEVEPDFIDSIDFKNIYTLLAGVCELLHSTNKLEFKVEGFGTNVWGMDISYDLLTVVEQLDNFFEWIDKGGEGKGNIDFYEQGAEFRLVFLSFNNKVKIEFESWTDHKLKYLTENSTLKELDFMFSKLLLNFVSEAKKVLPNLNSNQLFHEWCESHNLENRYKAK
jgi:hypothetical protein